MPFTVPVPAWWFRSKETILYTETMPYTIHCTCWFQGTETMQFTLPAGFTSEETMPSLYLLVSGKQKPCYLLYLLVSREQKQ